MTIARQNRPAKHANHAKSFRVHSRVWRAVSFPLRRGPRRHGEGGAFGPRVVLSRLQSVPPNKTLLVPRQARDEGKGREPLKLVIVTQWVRRRMLTNPTRPKASHQAGSRTEVRSSRDGVRSRGEARTQAAELNPEKCIVVVNG